MAKVTKDFKENFDTWAAHRIAIGGWTFFPADRSVESPYTGRILLTEKEAELLEVLARHPETVFSRRHLLSAVFDKGEQETMFLTERL